MCSAIVVISIVLVVAVDVVSAVARNMHSGPTTAKSMRAGGCSRIQKRTQNPLHQPMLIAHSWKPSAV